MYRIFFLIVLSFALCCSTAAKKSDELRKRQKPKNSYERKLLRFERRLKLSSEEREAIGNINNGSPYTKKQYKTYTKYHKKKRKIEKKLDRMTWKKQQSLQTRKTKKRMKTVRKKSERNNRFQRNKKINK